MINSDPVSRLSRRILRMASVAVLCLGFSLSFAAEAAKKAFDLPVGDAATTLKVFTQQSGEQIVYPVEQMRGVQTNAVKGELGPRAALDQMLKDTGLVVVQDAKTGALAVRRDADPNGPRAAQTDSARPESPSKVEDGKLVLDKFEVFGTKSINLDLPRTRDDVQPYMVFDRDRIQNSQAVNLQDFFTKFLPMHTELASPSQFAQLPNSSINLRGLGSNQTLILIDGRRVPGLSTGSAVINQGDINGIPVAMIERIEILPSTASGIYGGGATGGVVNIITRKDFAGAVLSLNYVNTFDTDAAQRRADLTASYNLRGGSTVFTLTASYADANTLLSQDRGLAQRAIRLLFANDPESFTGTSTPPTGYTPNIRSQNGSNLVLKTGAALNSPFTSVPVGYAGPASDGGAALVATAGRYNLDLPNDELGRKAGLFTNASPVTSLGLGLRQRLSSSLEAYVDFLRTRNRGVSPYLFPPTSTTLAATAPNNPFTTAINVAFPFPGLGDLMRPNVYVSESMRLTGGLVVKLPREWQAGLDYTWGRSPFTSTASARVLGDPDGTGPGISYNTAVATGVLDVLRDLNARPLDYTTYLMPGEDFHVQEGTMESQSATLRASGPIWRLSAGDIVLSSSFDWLSETKESGLQARAGTFAPGLTYTWLPEVSRSNRAFYSEVRVPLLAAADGSKQPRLELQFAGRYDAAKLRTTAGSIFVPVASASGPFPSINYVVRNLSDTTYTAGFRYAPSPDIALRASVGTGFLVPGLNQLSSANSLNLPFAFLADPKRGGIGSTIPITLSLGGNPDLKPEQSESFSTGAVFTPRWLPGFRLSVDYTRIHKTDELRSISQQQVVDLEGQLPGRVVRAPLTPADQALGYTGGVITQVDIRTTNIAQFKTEAVDFQIDYVRKTAFGEFRPYAIATWTRGFATQITPLVPYADSVGFNSAPLKWRANGGVDWSRGPWSAGWNTQYYASQRLYSVGSSAALIDFVQLTNGRTRHPSQFYHDAQVRYRFGPNGEGWRRLFSRVQISVGVQNVFDSEPPLTATDGTTGGYQYITDVRLRRYTLNLQKQF